MNPPLKCKFLCIIDGNLDLFTFTPIMTTNRLEAFSDGVFAIAATLLVLNIKFPELPGESNSQLNHLLIAALPNVLTFIFTFLVVGIFWTAHHRFFAMVKKVDQFLLWSNNFYLMLIALIPFPASLLAKHPLLNTAIIFYSSILFLCGLQHIILLLYLYKHTALLSKNAVLISFHSALKIAFVGPGCYLLAILASFITPFLSFFFIIVPLIFYIFLAPRLLKIKPDNL